MKFTNAQRHSVNIRTCVSPLQQCCSCTRTTATVSEQVLTAEHAEILSERVPDWMEKSNDSLLL